MKASDVDGFRDILSERLEADPKDVTTLRVQQDTAEPEEKSDVLKRHRELAEQHPDDPDWQYIGVRAMPDGPEKDRAFLEQHRRWPRNVWLSNAAGCAHARQADWTEALACFDLPLNRPGPCFDAAAMQVARIRRLVAKGGSPDLDDLRSSFEVKQMLALESGENLQGTPLYAYSLLNKGQIEDAYRAAGGSEADVRLLVLLAASEGAKTDWQQRALQIRIEDVEDPRLLAYLAALAFRNGQPYDSYLKECDEQFPKGRTSPVDHVRKLMEQGAPGESLHDQLIGLDLLGRGIVLSTAIVLYPDQSNEGLRETARALLFAMERPAF